MSSFLQGFYFIDNATYGPIGLGGSNSDQVVRAQSVFSRAIFNVVLTPESGKYLISLIGSPKGFFDEQLNATEDTAAGLPKIFARAPGSVDPQKWQIKIKDQSQDTYTISTADNSRFWVLDSVTPGTQVSSVVPTTQKEAWKFTKVTNCQWVANPLKTGNYYIQNFKNGVINSDSSSRVVSASTAAQWQITKVGDADSLEYNIIISSGSPANILNNFIVLRQGTAPEKWLIHPLPTPSSYMIFRAPASGPYHWQLKDNNLGTQVKVTTNTPVRQVLWQVVKGVPLIYQIEQLDSPDVDTDCFWLITAV